jgi:hypothetical protein
MSTQFLNNVTVTGKLSAGGGIYGLRLDPEGQLRYNDSDELQVQGEPGVVFFAVRPSHPQSTDNLNIKRFPDPVDLPCSTPYFKTVGSAWRQCIKNPALSYVIFVDEDVNESLASYNFSSSCTTRSYTAAELPQNFRNAGLKPGLYMWPKNRFDQPVYTTSTTANSSYLQQGLRIEARYLSELGVYVTRRKYNEPPRKIIYNVYVAQNANLARFNLGTNPQEWLRVPIWNTDRVQQGDVFYHYLTLHIFRQVTTGRFEPDFDALQEQRTDGEKPNFEIDPLVTRSFLFQRARIAPACSYNNICIEVDSNCTDVRPLICTDTHIDFRNVTFACLGQGVYKLGCVYGDGISHIYFTGENLADPLNRFSAVYPGYGLAVIGNRRPTFDGLATKLSCIARLNGQRFVARWGAINNPRAAGYLSHTHNIILDGSINFYLRGLTGPWYAPISSYLAQNACIFLGPNAQIRGFALRGGKDRHDINLTSTNWAVWPMAITFQPAWGKFLSFRYANARWSVTNWVLPNGTPTKFADQRFWNLNNSSNSVVPFNRVIENLNIADKSFKLSEEFRDDHNAIIQTSKGSINSSNLNRIFINTSPNELPLAYTRGTRPGWYSINGYNVRYY